jgi:integrase
MASLTTFKDGPRAGTYRIVLTMPDGRRAAIYLGRMEEDAAQKIRDRITSIEACRKAGDDLSRSLAAWVDSLADGFHEKLAKIGLVATRAAAPKQTVGGLIAAFLARAAHVKPSTRASYKQTTDSLLAFLGASTPLLDVTAEHADAWRAHIATEVEGTVKARVAKDNRLAPATVAKRVMVAKTIFGRAARWGWLQKSPLEHLRAGSQANPARAFYVTLEATEAILAKCPSLDWKVIVGLGRYAGLRVPSEIVAMTWDDVLWDSGRLVVRPSKTAGHEGHEVRVVPICPELRAILDQAYAAAAVGEKSVVPSLKSASKNLRTRFERIITRAGQKPWPRLFQNLRSSRATDWVEAYPSHIVAAWLGHSTAIAAAHYLQVRDHHFDAVVAGGGIHATRHATRAVPVGGSQGAVAVSQAPSLEWIEDAIEAALTSQGVATSRMVNSGIVGGEGLEPPTPSV